MDVELSGALALSIAAIVPVAFISDAHVMPDAPPRLRSESTIGSNPEQPRHQMVIRAVRARPTRSVGETRRCMHGM
jgi:hypothetical protein